MSDWNRRRWAQQRAFLAALKLELGCADCGPEVRYTDPAMLEFDHVGSKRSHVGSRTSWDSLLAELDECEVVCANHHNVRTADRKDVGRGLWDSASWLQ